VWTAELGTGLKKRDNLFERFAAATVTILNQLMFAFRRQSSFAVLFQREMS
jgi:hypothetical protein